MLPQHYCEPPLEDDDHFTETDNKEKEDTDEVTELVYGVDMDGESYADLPPGVFQFPRRSNTGTRRLELEFSIN